MEDDEGFVEFLEWIEKKEDDVTEDDIQDYDDEHSSHDVKWFNSELYGVLVGMSIAGPTKDRLMNLDDRKKVRGAQGFFSLT